MELIQIAGLVSIAGAWFWVLGRPLVHNLLDRARRDPVGQFNREMSVLGGSQGKLRTSGYRPGGQTGVANLARRSAQKRRRVILLGLGFAAIISLVGAVVFGGTFVVQHLVLDALLIGYIVLAARAGAAQMERGTKVSRLAVAQVPNPVLAKAANGR